MRIAVLADAHGNLLALQAVLADLREAAPDLAVNVGDLVSGPFDPAGAAGAPMALACPTLAGNHERQVLAGGDIGLSNAFARPRLSGTHLNWLAALPPTLTLLNGEVFACRGSTADGAEAVTGRRNATLEQAGNRPYSHVGDLPCLLSHKSLLTVRAANAWKPGSPPSRKRLSSAPPNSKAAA